MNNKHNNTLHNKGINDYTSYRGMLIMTGINPNAKESEHIIRSKDGKAAVWAGVIDDLWGMGKPSGQGGPWKDSQIEAGVPSDPYLIGFYDNRTLQILHNSKEAVSFTIEVDPIGHGPWMLYKDFSVKPGETFYLTIPANLRARWIRFSANSNCKATAWLTYN